MPPAAPLPIYCLHLPDGNRFNWKLTWDGKRIPECLPQMARFSTLRKDGAVSKVLCVEPNCACSETISFMRNGTIRGEYLANL